MPRRSPRRRPTAVPARELQLVGVTGTNGKTTTVSMLRHLLDDAHVRSASIGTLGVLIGSEGTPLDGGGGLTTPGPDRAAASLSRAGRRRRSAASRWRCRRTRSISVAWKACCSTSSMFTNFTRDHLDYHGAMEQVLRREGQLARSPAAARHRRVQRRRPRVARAQDRPAPRGVQRARHVGRGDTPRTCATARAEASGRCGSNQERAPVRLPLIGDFNVINALGAAAAAYALGVPSRTNRRTAVDHAAGARAARGAARAPTVLRDYAHTPDALARALDAVRPFAPGAADRRLRLRRRSRPRQAAGDGRDRRRRRPTWRSSRATIRAPKIPKRFSTRSKPG